MSSHAPSFFGVGRVERKHSKAAMKNKRARSRKNVEAPGLAFEQTLHCCDHIQTVAGLLQAYGSHPHGEPLPAPLVASAGYLLGDEARQLRHLLNQLLRR